MISKSLLAHHSFIPAAVSTVDDDEDDEDDEEVKEVEEVEEDEEDEGRGCGVVPPMTSSGVVGAKRLGDVLMPPLMPPPMLKGTMAWLGNKGEMVDIQMSYTLSKVKQC